METKKFKYKYNFFLTEEEKELFFTLKKIHRLNNQLGSDNVPYQVFIKEMKNYYDNILYETCCEKPIDLQSIG